MKKRPAVTDRSRRRPAIWLAVIFLLFFSYLSLIVYQDILIDLTSRLTALPTNVADQMESPAPFPIGVDPDRKLITERANVENYLANSLASNHRRRSGDSWLSRIAGRLIQSPTFQQLASPFNRTLVIFSGERKEEVIDNIGDILRWDQEERLTFESLVAESRPVLDEGKFFPGNYTVEKDADPALVAGLINREFSDEMLARYPDEVEQMVPFSQAMIIASLLEREARDFEDMRYISGVIWNRLFIDMNLQLDATLQYVKGEQANQPWWPLVAPEDKFLESPFNTYENNGLPPGPIANPSVDAILAALNPRATDCLFYFHDDSGNFHCTKTYEEHVAALKEIYGQGR